MVFDRLGVGPPWMLVDQLTIDDAAGASTTLSALLVVVALAIVFVLPGLVFLLKLSQSAPTSEAVALEPGVGRRA